MMSKKKESDLDRKASLTYADNIITTLREPFLVLNKQLRVISANDAFYANFKVSKKDTLGCKLHDLGNKQWNIPRLLQVLRQVIPDKKNIRDYEVEHKFEHIGKRTMRLNACQINASKYIMKKLTRDTKEEQIGEELILLVIEDITERKLLEQTVKESEERYRRAFETSRDGLLLIHKTKGDILNSNASVQELLGYSEKELLKKKLWEIGVTNDSSDFQKTVSRLGKNVVVHYEDLQALTKEGLHINSEVFLVNKANVIQCNVRDISMRRQEEDTLKESEMKFKTIFSESADGMLLAAVENRRFFMCNPKICQMLGYTKEELTKMKVDDIHPKNELASVLSHFKRQADGENKVATLPVERKNGSIFYADINTSQLSLKGKKYLMSSFREITELKALEKKQELIIQILLELAKHEEWCDAMHRVLKLIQEQTRIEVVALRLREGDDYPYFVQFGFSDEFVEAENYLCERTEKGKIVYDYMGNPVLDCMCGIVIRGKTDPNLSYITKDGSFWTNSTTRLLATTIEKECQTCTRKRCSREGYESVALIPLRSSGDIVGILQLNDKRKNCFDLDFIRFMEGIGSSIGSAFIRRRAEKAVKQALNAKSDFTAMVSHELRTPLSVIKEGVNVVLGEIVGRTSEEQKKYLEMIKNNVDRLNRLIEDILDFQAVESGKMKFKMEENDINGIVKEMRQAMLPVAEKKNLDLICQLDENLPPIIFDRDRIIQVLSNLINNALKFTDKGSITIGTSKEDNFIKITIRDTGRGIKKEDMHKLFQQFTQLQRNIGGAGLGLSICRKIIKAHKGKIWVESEFGKGAIFHFNLPIKKRKV